jgi:hypothetical protein
MLFFLGRVAQATDSRGGDSNFVGALNTESFASQSGSPIELGMYDPDVGAYYSRGGNDIFFFRCDHYKEEIHPYFQQDFVSFRFEEFEKGEEERQQARAAEDRRRTDTANSDGADPGALP